MSPVTLDWVNPASRWPHLSALAAACSARRKQLLPRLPIYPEYIQEGDLWLDQSQRVPGMPTLSPSKMSEHSASGVTSVLGRALASCDAAGYARASGWFAGQVSPPDMASHETGKQQAVELIQRMPTDPQAKSSSYSHVKAPQARWDVHVGSDGALEGCSGPPVTAKVQAVLDQLAVAHSATGGGMYSGATNSSDVGAQDVVALLSARGASARAVVQAADDLRKRVNGDTVTYVVNRNINYTNMCTYGCDPCGWHVYPRAGHGILIHGYSMYPW